MDQREHVKFILVYHQMKAKTSEGMTMLLIFWPLMMIKTLLDIQMNIPNLMVYFIMTNILNHQMIHALEQYLKLNILKLHLKLYFHIFQECMRQVMFRCVWWIFKTNCYGWLMEMERINKHLRGHQCLLILNSFGEYENTDLVTFFNLN